MDSYIKPCDQFPNENYDFTVTCVNEDDEEILYQLDWNERCNICFLKEQCANDVMKAIENTFDDVEYQDLSIIYEDIKS